MQDNIRLQRQQLARLDRAAAGAFLVLLGVVFLLRDTAFGILGQWSWTIFLAIPIFWLWISAYRAYLLAGRRVTRDVRNRLLWSAFPLLSVVWWRLGLDYQLLGPIILIVIGVSIVLNRRNA